MSTGGQHSDGFSQHLGQHRAATLSAMTTYPLLRELNTEWELLVGQHDPTLTAWACRQPALAEASGLQDLLVLIRRSPDPTLGALLRLGFEGESLARRVVMQALLGKLVLLSKGRPEWFDEAVSALWVAIAEYPLHRRPQAIVSNLLWTLRRELRPPVSVLMPVAPAEQTAEETLHAAMTLRLINDETLRTLWLVYILGLSSDRAGAVLGISAETVRYRCSRDLRRLAGRAPLLAA